MNDAKYAAELKFWEEEKQRYIDWYNGKMLEMYGIPRPTEREMIRRHNDIFLNALDTWCLADKWRYCWHLFVEPTYWSGKTILEIGSGPLGLSQFFAGAIVYAVDALTESYEKLGYPIQSQSIAYAFKSGEPGMKAEDIGLGDRTFDAAFSVNAIDHVDDFESAARELERVVKPNGEIRIETHYHAATTTEPNVLTDARVKAAFQKFDVQKISEKPSSYFYPAGTHPPEDRFVLWSNVPYLYPAREVLR